MLYPAKHLNSVLIQMLGEEPKLCFIRKDILEKGLKVPIGDDHFSDSPEAFLYRWADDDTNFQVWNDGCFEEAQSIDFDFPDTQIEPISDKEQKLLTALKNIYTEFAVDLRIREANDPETYDSLYEETMDENDGSWAAALRETESLIDELDPKFFEKSLIE